LITEKDILPSAHYKIDALSVFLTVCHESPIVSYSKEDIDIALIEIEKLLQLASAQNSIDRLQQMQKAAHVLLANATKGNLSVNYLESDAEKSLDFLLTTAPAGEKETHPGLLVAAAIPSMNWYSIFSDNSRTSSANSTSNTFKYPARSQTLPTKGEGNYAHAASGKSISVYFNGINHYEQMNTAPHYKRAVQVSPNLITTDKHNSASASSLTLSSKQDTVNNSESDGKKESLSISKFQSPISSPSAFFSMNSSSSSSLYTVPQPVMQQIRLMELD